MRTLSPAMLTELGLTVTRPGYLVEIGFSTTLRMSTLGDLSYAGQTWVGSDVRVSGMSRNEQGGQAGTLVIGNTDLMIGAYLLTEGVADKGIRIWSVWAGAPGDAVLEFDGIGDDAELSGTQATIRLANDHQRYAYAPRRFINAPAGFNTLLPAGAKISIGGQSYVLERA